MNEIPAARPGRQFNRRLGLILFTFYTVIYALFVALAAFAPHLMASPAFASINVAVVFGFGLIILPLGLALIFALACRSDE